MSEQGFGHQLRAVYGNLIHLMRDRPDDVLRYGIKGAVEIDRYFIEAQALGADRDAAEQLLDDTRKECLEYGSQPVSVARQRLLDIYAAGQPIPGPQWRAAAADLLVSQGAWSDPVSIDRLARRLELMAVELGRRAA